MVILFNLKGAQDFGSIFVPLKFYSFRLIKGYTRTNSTHNRVQRDIFNDNLNFSYTYNSTFPLAINFTNFQVETAVTDQTEHLTDTFSLTFHLLRFVINRGSGVSSFANLPVPFSRETISRGKWVGENRGGCAIESQEHSRKKEKKSRKRVQIFANNTRNTAYKTRWNIPLPRLPSLYWILRINKPRLRHEHADPNATRLQRGVSTQNREHPRLVRPFYRRILKMYRH